MGSIAKKMKAGTQTIGTWFGVDKKKMGSTFSWAQTNDQKLRAQELKRKAKRSRIDLPEDPTRLGNAGRRVIDASRARGGRLSTILSDTDNRLGG
jgi:hypothetical protein